MIKGFLGAISFLTVIPVYKKSHVKLEDSIIFFPVVGFLIGTLLVIINIISSGYVPKLVNDAIVLVALVIITGGLHIDGFSDTIDGIFSRKNKNEIIKIMDDSHIGAIGTVSIFCLLFIKFVFLHSIIEKYFIISLLLMPVLGRYSMIFAGKFSQPVKSTGLGNTFVTNTKTGDFIVGTLFTLVISFLLLKTTGIIIWGIVFVSIFVITKFFIKKIGGMTGDTLGALNELVELIVLFIFVTIK